LSHAVAVMAYVYVQYLCYCFCTCPVSNFTKLHVTSCTNRAGCIFVDYRTIQTGRQIQLS